MKQTNQTKRPTSQVTVPLSNGAALPPPPHSRQPGTSLQTQSRAPSLPWASVQWCHLLKSLRASWAFPPSLQQGRFQKGRPVSQSSQERFQVWDLETTRDLRWKPIRSSRLTDWAQQPHRHRSRPETLEPVSNRRLAVCTTCWARIGLLPICSPLALDKGAVLHPRPWRTRDAQGYKEVADGGLNTALPAPLSTGGTSQPDTCSSYIHSFLHLFIYSLSQRNVCGGAASVFPSVKRKE